MKKQLVVESLDPRTLVPNKWNPNDVSPDNEKKLLESIKRFGFFRPVIVRTLEDGTPEIIGGEHRSAAAIKLGIETIPVINLGEVDDKTAKEILLTDNGRYGSDNLSVLAKVLEDIGTFDEITEFMPYTENDLTSIFSAITVDLDSLEYEEEEPEDVKLNELPAVRTAPTVSVQRFKIPTADVEMVDRAIKKVMKEEGYVTEDSLTNAGNALVSLCSRYLGGK